MACCNKCGSTSSCGCATAYYNDAEVCAEDNCANIYQPQFSFGVCSNNGWNIPSCGQSAVLNVDGVIGASVGSYLWAETYGYYKIQSVDAERGQIIVINTCEDENANPGTQVPPCTCFVVTVPPLSTTTDTTQACVKIDFTAPADGTCIDIILSTTQGITASDTVQIGTGFYFVEAIKPNDIITICNHGEGISPGTAVIARGVDGQFQYCLSTISTNPCNRDNVSEGTLLVCDEDGVTRPLGTPCEAGYVPVATGDCTVEMQPVITPVLCTHLSEQLQIVNGDATYSLVVESTTGYTTSDILTISGLPSGTRADVTAVPDATHIAVTLSPTPAAGVLLPVGTLVCTIACCEDIQNQLVVIDTQIADLADIDVDLQGQIDDLVTSIDCVAQGTSLAIPAQIYTQTITVAANTYEVTLDSDVIQFTAPSDCPGSTYVVQAIVNLTGLVNFTPLVAGEAAVLGSELQIDWSNNVGVGGRVNWTQTSGDGVDITGAYPTTTLNAIWGILQLLTYTYPINYTGSYAIASTLVASGATVTLRLNYKCITGDNVEPTNVYSVGVYMIGNLFITKVI